MTSSVFFAVLCSALVCAGVQAQAPHAKVAPYGSNAAAGATFVHDGVTVYYEVYGSGAPLLLIHGNGASIGSFGAQIDYFLKHYKVIAMDSRDQGKSSDSNGPITYEVMTADLAALLDHLKTGPVYVLGWSDGGIEALELGMKYPAKVTKIASMAANLEPDGATPEALKWVKDEFASMPPAVKASPEGKRELKVGGMMLVEPHIPLAALETIKAPTLILAGDHDLIRDDHTLAIYHHIPNGELAIFPNSTHFVPYDDSALFNATVARFFSTPYVKKDRVKDVMKSLESMQAGK